MPRVRDYRYDEAIGFTISAWQVFGKVLEVGLLMHAKGCAMIHFTCDSCKQLIDSERDLRYVVRMEVYASLDTAEEDLDDEREHLAEIQDILDRLEDPEDLSMDEKLGDEIYQQKRFDLCSTCRDHFMQNPLGRSRSNLLGFSQN